MPKSAISGACTDEMNSGVSHEQATTINQSYQSDFFCSKWFNIRPSNIRVGVGEDNMPVNTIHFFLKRKQKITLQCYGNVPEIRLKTHDRRCSGSHKNKQQQQHAY